MAVEFKGLPSPSHGNYVTILSIDGGGVRGLIPAVLLQYLESELQKFDENARIADYFDVIAGTSTGGLIATMLTAPDPNNKTRPLFTTSQIVDFYKKKSPEIFSDKTILLRNNEVEVLTQIETQVQVQAQAKEEEVEEDYKTETMVLADQPHVRGFFIGPSYSGRPLREILQQELKETRLHDALTNVVIPTYDMKRTSPTLFSSYKLEEVPELDAKLSDICLGTSAAPTYFPPHYFENEDKEFHLIDGGIAACNPGLAAISEVAQQKNVNPRLFPMMKDPSDRTNFVMISLGCGLRAVKKSYDARCAAWWGKLGWAGPVVDLMMDGSQDMIEYHLATVFHAVHAQDHYLRIQDNALTNEMAQMDNASEDNLDDLENYAKELLSKPVKRVNTHTFELEPLLGKGTNAEALTSMAKRLHKEKQDRLKKMAAS